MPMPRKRSLVAAFALAAGLLLAPQLAPQAEANCVQYPGEPDFSGVFIHMPVTYSDPYQTITKTYKLPSNLHLEAESFLSIPGLTQREMFGWFKHHGAVLDNPNGAASVSVYSNGARVEEYRRNGRLHCDLGPALIRTQPNGVRTELNYSNGQLMPATNFFPNPVQPQQNWQKGNSFPPRQQPKQHRRNRHN